MTAPADSSAKPDLAAAALARYPADPDARLDFVRYGENTTYRVRQASGDWALRLERPGYQSVAAVRSEIVWMRALHEDGISTPEPVCGRDGDVVQVVEHEGGERIAVAFRWVGGRPLTGLQDSDPWRRVGAIMARIHEHGRRWVPPAGFVRPAWDREAVVGDRARWGDPFPAGVWAPEDLRALQAAREAVRERLDRFGCSGRRFGLVHADLGFENVLVQDDGTAIVIDFDDSGPSWFLYDIATVLYPLEGLSYFSPARDALVDGYRAVRSLPDEDLAELPTFLMARRFATLGWVFTRADTEHARRQRARRLESSPDAARAFLARYASR